MSRLLFIPLLLMCLPCSAATVYKSVDLRGRVTFSDTPPAQAVSVETLEVQVQSAADPELYLRRMAVMSELTDKIAAARVQREQQRLASRKQRAEPGPGAPAARQDVYYDGYYSGYYNSYYNSYYNPVRRRHRLNPYPVHPAARAPHPPLRGPALVNQYPASLVRRSYSPRVAAVFQNSAAVH
jgi:hypothetical protein